ncbi:hypothetical protein COLO4_00759, partial [Corchorus olitorius]
MDRTHQSAGPWTPFKTSPHDSIGRPFGTPPAALLRTLHLAGSWLRRDVLIEHRVGLPAVAGIFLVELDALAVGLLPGGDEERLLALVVRRAHLEGAIQAVDLHAFEGLGHLGGFCRLGLLDGLGQHGDAGIRRHEVVVVVVLLLVALDDIGALVAVVVDVPVADELHMVGTSGAHRRRHAGGGAVVRVEIGVEARILAGLDEQSQVAAPVAGDDGIGAGRFDLRHIRREILHLRQRVQIFTHDLDVRTLAFQVFLGRTGNLMPERIVLVDQVDLLDLRILRQEARQGFHLHVGVGVQAEVPIVALAVGHVRVHRGVIQVDDFLARITLVVLGHGVFQRHADARAVALHDVMDALIGDLLEHGQALLRRELVVEADHFELGAVAGPVLLRGEIGDVLPAAQLVLAQRAHQAGQRIDPGDLHGFGGGRCSRQNCPTDRRNTCNSHNQRTELRHACLLHVVEPPASHSPRASGGLAAACVSRLQRARASFRCIGHRYTAAGPDP